MVSSCCDFQSTVSQMLKFNSSNLGTVYFQVYPQITLHKSELTLISLFMLLNPVLEYFQTQFHFSSKYLHSFTLYLQDHNISIFCYLSDLPQSQSLVILAVFYMRFQLRLFYSLLAKTLDLILVSHFFLIEISANDMDYYMK